jgi:hypothetical protein
MEARRMRARFLTALSASVLVLSIVLLAIPSTTTANESKVEICHSPPGNPANFHTIRIRETGP